MKKLKISRYIPSSSQAKLNLFVTEKRASLAIEHPYEARLRQALFLVLAVCIFAYLYFVAASVLNIMARREADAASLALQSSIASMEGDYFALRDSVNPSMEGVIGLAPIAKTDYVYRPGNAASAADTIGSNAI